MESKGGKWGWKWEPKLGFPVLTELSSWPCAVSGDLGSFANTWGQRIPGCRCRGLVLGRQRLGWCQAVVTSRSWMVPPWLKVGPGLLTLVHRVAVSIFVTDMCPQPLLSPPFLPLGSCPSQVFCFQSGTQTVSYFGSQPKESKPLQR